MFNPRTIEIQAMVQKKQTKASRSLDMRRIFRYMMEEGYYPTFEENHILFDFEDNLGIVEYEDGILFIRIFFSTEDNDTSIFLESSNATMITTCIVKPVLLDEFQSLLFSCEIMCDTLRELRKFFPQGLLLLTDAINEHKRQTKQLMLAQNAVQTFQPQKKNHNLLS